MQPAAVTDVLTRLARKDGGRVLALLARQFNDLDLADEAVQDGLLEAWQSWPQQGVPDNPAAWLVTVAGARRWTGCVGPRARADVRRPRPRTCSRAGRLRTDANS